MLAEVKITVNMNLASLYDVEYDQWLARTISLLKDNRLIKTHKICRPVNNPRTSNMAE
jgi:hypothetical protein